MRPRIAAGVLLAALTGCGGGPQPPATDPASLEQTEKSVQKARQAEANKPSPIEVLENPPPP